MLAVLVATILLQITKADGVQDEKLRCNVNANWAVIFRAFNVPDELKYACAEQTVKTALTMMRNNDKSELLSGIDSFFSKDGNIKDLPKELLEFIVTFGPLRLKSLLEMLVSTGGDESDEYVYDYSDPYSDGTDSDDSSEKSSAGHVRRRFRSRDQAKPRSFLKGKSGKSALTGKKQKSRKIGPLERYALDDEFIRSQTLQSQQPTVPAPVTGNENDTQSAANELDPETDSLASAMESAQPTLNTPDETITDLPTGGSENVPSEAEVELSGVSKAPDAATIEETKQDQFLRPAAKQADDIVLDQLQSAANTEPQVEVTSQVNDEPTELAPVDLEQTDAEGTGQLSIPEAVNEPEAVTKPGESETELEEEKPASEIVKKEDADKQIAPVNKTPARKAQQDDAFVPQKIGQTVPAEADIEQKPTVEGLTKKPALKSKKGKKTTNKKPNLEPKSGGLSKDNNTEAARYLFHSWLDWLFNRFRGITNLQKNTPNGGQ